MNYKILKKNKISRTKSEQLILMMAIHGNHYTDDSLRTEDSVKAAFKTNNINFKQLIKECGRCNLLGA
jgi:cobalamin biosynthesis Co2+ chelatase CbiK